MSASRSTFATIEAAEIVAFDDVHFPRVDMKRVAVEEDGRDVGTLRFHCFDDAREGGAQARGHAVRVNVGRLGVVDCPRKRNVLDSACELLAFFRGKLLGIVKAGNARGRGKHDGADRQRSGDRPASDLVKPDDVLERPPCLLGGIERCKPPCFGRFRVQAPARRSDGLLHSLARVCGQCTLERAELCFVGAGKARFDVGDGSRDVGSGHASFLCCYSDWVSDSRTG